MWPNKMGVVATISFPDSTLDSRMPGGKLNDEPALALNRNLSQGLYIYTQKSDNTFHLFCAKATCKAEGNCGLGLEDVQTSNCKIGPNLCQVWETRVAQL